MMKSVNDGNRGIAGRVHLHILTVFGLLVFLVTGMQHALGAPVWQGGQAVFQQGSSYGSYQKVVRVGKRRARSRRRSRARYSRRKKNARRARAAARRKARLRRKRQAPQGEVVADNRVPSRRFAKRRSSSRSSRARTRRQSARRAAAAVARGKQTGHKKGKKSATPLQIVVSLPDQRLSVYKGTRRIATSRVSSGKAGHRTPTGVFTIIQKNKHHRSNIYGGAPMPFMQRITWSGIALHAGKIPPYPASHGCIRLPYGFARKLFRYTRKGKVHVIVQRGNSVPHLFKHDMLFNYIPKKLMVSAEPVVSKIRLDGKSAGDVVLDSAVMERPAKTTKAKTTKSNLPLRILMTRTTRREKLRAAQVLLNDLGYEPGRMDGNWGRRSSMAVRMFQEDMELPVTGVFSEGLVDRLQKMTGRQMVGSGHIYVRQGFADLFDAPIEIRETEGKKLGTHVFTALSIDETGENAVRWMKTTVRESGSRGKRVKVRYRDRRGRRRVKYVYRKSAGRMNASDALNHIVVPQEVRNRIGRILTPGSSVIVSDYSYSFETGKGTDFVVLTK